MESYISRIDSYDKLGNCIKSISFNDKGGIKQDVEISMYNQQSQLIEDSLYTNSVGNHQLIWRRRYTYYDNGLIKTESKVNESCSEGYNERRSYFYNAAGYMDKILIEHACNDSMQATQFNFPIYFKYDSKGNLLSKTALNKDTSEVFYKDIYTYNSAGKELEDAYYFYQLDTLMLITTRQNFYNSENQKILSKRIVSPTDIDSTGYTYYPNGLLKEEISYPKYADESKQWIQYYYDKNGNTIKEQNFYLDKKKKVKKGVATIITYAYY